MKSGESINNTVGYSTCAISRIILYDISRGTSTIKSVPPNMDGTVNYLLSRWNPGVQYKGSKITLDKAPYHDEVSATIISNPTLRRQHFLFGWCCLNNHTHSDVLWGWNWEATSFTRHFFHSLILLNSKSACSIFLTFHNLQAEFARGFIVKHRVWPSILIGCPTKLIAVWTSYSF